VAWDVSKLDWSRCRYKPFIHQIEGTGALLEHRAFGLLDEQGAGKTKQVIDAACFMYEAGDIDTILVFCPAQVKDVWIHPQFSQIIEHSWVKGIIHEFTSYSNKLPDKSRGLLWVVASVELMRNPKHVQQLLNFLQHRKIWIVDDESSTISNHKAAQTKGVLAFRTRAHRRTILNGTPIGQSILNLYTQFYFLDPVILGFKNYYAFRNHHCKMGGYMNKQVVGYYHLEELQDKIKPFVLRRLKDQCLDIPAKIRAPLREVKLLSKTWEIYVSMREELIAYLKNTDDVSVVGTAPVKALRLAQICSGFLGGIDDDDDVSKKRTVEIGTELTSAFLDYLEFRISQESGFKLIVWCRFRPEIARLELMAKRRFPNLMVRVLQGGQSKADRDEAVSLFQPNAPDPAGPALLIGQPQAGRFGHNFTKCSNVDYLSNDHSYLTRSQSEDRIHRPGQRFQALFQDYIVVGPNRERTVSGMILKALRKHEELATWTCSRWVAEIMQEDNDVPF
jgi:SNF2 family DNA or RNA helicase